ANSLAVDVAARRPTVARTPLGRYRYPGDVARLIVSGLLLVLVVVLGFLFPERLLGSRASTISRVKPDTSAFHLLVGLVHGLVLVGGVAVAATVARHRRFRLAGSLLAAGAAAGLAF